MTDIAAPVTLHELVPPGQANWLEAKLVYEQAVADFFGAVLAVVISTTTFSYVLVFPAIVALRSVIQSVRTLFSSEARTLIAADIVVGTTRDWEPEKLTAIDRRLREAGSRTVRRAPVSSQCPRTLRG